MAYIIWKDSFDVGVKEMDEQHKLFINHINELHDSIQFGNSESIIVATLNELADYINLHFVAEEKLLRSLDYPMLDVQIKQHAYYISELNTLKNKYLNKSQSAQSMFLFLKDWFVHHIITEDKKYIKYVLFNSNRLYGSSDTKEI